MSQLKCSPPSEHGSEYCLQNCREIFLSAASLVKKSLLYDVYMELL